MVLLLGINFAERQLVRKALTSLYGISGNATTCLSTSRRLPPALAHLVNRPSGTKPAPSPARHNLLDRLMSQHYIHPTATLGSLSDSVVVALTASLSRLTIENDLRRRLVDNIKRLRDMGSYRGRRHDMGLPVRGQRTRTQTNTAVKLNRIERRG